ncbi:hypothetical protein BKA81DRAFT_192541 [Phyllosticta paracitricarpa]
MRIVNNLSFTGSRLAFGASVIVSRSLLSSGQRHGEVMGGLVPNALKITAASLKRRRTIAMLTMRTRIPSTLFKEHSRLLPIWSGNLRDPRTVPSRRLFMWSREKQVMQRRPMEAPEHIHTKPLSPQSYLLSGTKIPTYKITLQKRSLVQNSATENTSKRYLSGPQPFL